mgnify:CR=1 FL=1
MEYYEGLKRAIVYHTGRVYLEYTEFLSRQVPEVVRAAREEYPEKL